MQIYMLQSHHHMLQIYMLQSHQAKNDQNMPKASEWIIPNMKNWYRIKIRYQVNNLK